MGSFLRDLGVLYRRELRSALRERSIVVNGILIPIFLYPVLLWSLFTALTFVQGQSEGFVSRVVIPDPGPFPELTAALADRSDVRIVEGLAPDSLSALVDRGEIDAVVRYEAAAALPGNVGVRVSFDRSEGRSRNAIERIDETVDSLRAIRLAREAAALGLDTVALRVFEVEAEDVATDEEGGRLFLAIVLPLFLTLMVALGCFIPAVDATAGERERSTWETLWTTGASRGSIVLAKYLLVATIGALAGVLNVAAISLSLGSILTPLFGDQAEAMGLALPLDAIPVMMAVAVLLALLFAALMMVLAVFARTFKEGQAMVVPAYYLAVLPALLGSSPDRGLTPSVALVPVANVALGLKDAILGRDEPALLLVAFFVNLACVVGCLLLARSLVLREEVVTGTFEGSFWSWLRKRRRP
ncbi:MAG: ABC transporter permease subunit [Gemmatimonadetes bacterium]|nr:ABC transporter permease subunit [Gemmatimonadota bacterium]NNK63708.1 ABC transporter permease [Gemmatimonadota bacterium]